MTEKQVEQREVALEQSGCICPICKGSIYQYGTPQLAHRIGNTVVNRKKYGDFIIDSPENSRYVCSLSCNASVDVGKSEGKQLEVVAEVLIYEIKNKFGNTGLSNLIDIMLNKIK